MALIASLLLKYGLSSSRMALIASPLLKYGLSSSRVALIASPPRCGQVCSPNPCNQAGDSRGTCQVRDGLQLQSLLRMLLQL